MSDERQLRRRLLEWYRSAGRDLPWRRTRDPYAIWVSEVMLQQTRVAAMLPYYERFLARYPNVESLAAAPAQEVLAAWSGLGYYSRVRNLYQAAQQIAARGGFPRDYEAIRRLPGIGEYTAAAIASIAFSLPHPVMDGNVLRLLSRLKNETGEIRLAATRRRLNELAGRLLDRRDPGGFNQALMELGATVCLPRQPRCAECPLAGDCAARRLGVENSLPVKAPRSRPVRETETLLWIEREGAVLLRQRPAESKRLAGFWELPPAGSLPRARRIRQIGSFRHSIVHHEYTVAVVEAQVSRPGKAFQWIPLGSLGALALSTTARKALALVAAR